MSRYWRCTRQVAGVVCRQLNLCTKRACTECGKPRPAKRKPKHMAALALSYEEYVTLNGGEACGICGATQKEGGRRLHRDHDHKTAQGRGLLCFRCNRALPSWVTPAWLRDAAAYLERAAA